MRWVMIAFAVFLVACEEVPEDPCIPVIRLGTPIEDTGSFTTIQNRIQAAGIDDVRARQCATKTIQCADGSIDPAGFCSPNQGFAKLPTTGACPLGSVLDERSECRRCPPGFAATFDGRMCIPDTMSFNTCTPASIVGGCYDSSQDALGMKGFISAGAFGPAKSGTCEKATQLANIACVERSRLKGNTDPALSGCKRTLPCDCLCALQSSFGCACNVYGEYFPGPPASNPLDPLMPTFP